MLAATFLEKPEFNVISTIRSVLCTLLVCLLLTACSGPEQEPVRIGILHSQSGTMASSESALIDAALLAIEELNAAGGVLGRPLESVLADGQSDSDAFMAEAERLIVEEKVAAVFGTWTSEHRKAVKDVVEDHNALLFYPLQYEGLEQSPNIVYLGPTPNQQIIPAVEWCHRFLGPRMFLVGSDYVFPRVANAIVKDELAEFGVDPVGERYVPLGGTDFKAVVQDILAARPDVILNMINGDSNAAFFRELRNAGISPEEIPVMSFSVGESELQGLGAEDLSGNYSAWSYFQSIDTAVNRKFVQAFTSRYGEGRVIGDPMEATHAGIHLWASAVESSGSLELERVKPALYGRTSTAARGAVRVDGKNQHLWQVARIGRLQGNGQFDIVWESGILPPVNFPASRERHEWQELLDGLYREWGGNWASPNSD